MCYIVKDNHITVRISYPCDYPCSTLHRNLQALVALESETCNVVWVHIGKV